MARPVRLRWRDPPQRGQTARRSARRRAPTTPTAPMGSTALRPAAAAAGSGSVGRAAAGQPLVHSACRAAPVRGTQTLWARPAQLAATPARCGRSPKSRPVTAGGRRLRGWEMGCGKSRLWPFLKILVRVWFFGFMQKKDLGFSTIVLLFYFAISDDGGHIYLGHSVDLHCAEQVWWPPTPFSPLDTTSHDSVPIR